MRATDDNGDFRLIARSCATGQTAAGALIAVAMGGCSVSCDPEPADELHSPLRRLVAGFPDVPSDVVASFLADAYILVVTSTGEPLVDKAEQLATLRLEIRTGHPLSPLPPVETTPSRAEDYAVVRARACRVAAEAKRSTLRAERLASEVRDQLTRAARSLAAAPRCLQPNSDAGSD